MFKKGAKQKMKQFWKQWGVTLEEIGMLIGAGSVLILPLLLRLVFAIFGI